MMKENKKSPFKKTEELLRNYNRYKFAIKNNCENVEKTKKLIKIVDGALKSIENDKYYPVIEMIFFEHKSREDVAEMFDCEVKTITRNKNRLINNLQMIIFSDESIVDIFS